MQHRTWGFAAVGVAAVGLCAVLATTALASSDHGTERQAIKQSQTAAAKPGASFGVKPVAGSTKQSQTAAQQPAKTKVSSSDGTKSQMSEENQLLLKIQIKSRRRPVVRPRPRSPRPTSKSAYARLVGQLFSVTGSLEQAEDVVQEAFIRALDRWPRIQAHDVPELWMRRVAINLAVSEIRRMR